MLIKALKHQSITGRLAFLYTLSALATLGLTAFFFTWSLQDSIFREESEFVKDRLRVYDSIIKSQPDYLKIIQRDIEWEGSYVEFPEYYTRVLTNGKIILDTPGMAAMIPESWFSRLQAPPVTIDGEYFIHTSKNGRSFLLKVQTFQVANGKEPITIQMAADISSSMAIISEKKRIVIILFFCGIILATVVGVLVARNALSPLKELVSIVEQITICRINMRTDPASWPTELRSLAVAFNGMLQRLEESFSHLSQLSSNLAHELRTPINNLLLESEVILAQARTVEEYRKTIESGIEEYFRLSRIIDSMLFLARAENPATRISKEWFSVAEEVNKVCSFYEALAEEHNATLVVKGTGQLCGDHQLFSRVISNLLANALFYSPPGVRIEIDICQGDDDSLHVAVSDTGFGIAAEDLSHIYDRFFRSDKMRTIHKEGTGLGLAIVKSIMDLHHGTVAIHSTSGQGTTVQLRFPPPAPDLRSQNPAT